MKERERVNNKQQRRRNLPNNKKKEKFHNDNNLYALCTQETYTQLSSVACDEPVMTSCNPHPHPPPVRAGRTIQHGAQEQ